MYFYDDLAKFHVEQKDFNIMNLMDNVLTKTNHMFEWSNLPETIPANILERMLQELGSCTFAEHEGDYYIFRSELGGDEDVYNRPTVANINSAALGLTTELKIDEECVVINNDEYKIGLLPSIFKYGSYAVEADITALQQMILLRSPYAIEATTADGVKSAELFLDAIERGENAVLFADNYFSESPSDFNVHALETGKQNVTDLIEAVQYKKSEFFNDLGININENMKRTYISDSEQDNQSQANKMFLNAMLISRKTAVEKINELFGLNIEVEISELWINSLKGEDDETGGQDPGGDEQQEGEPETPELEESESGDADNEGETDLSRENDERSTDSEQDEEIEEDDEDEED